MRSKVSSSSCLLPVCRVCVYLAVKSVHALYPSFFFLFFSCFLFQFNFISFPFFLQKKPARRRYENYGMYSDDDANSDASSACSERSYSSRNGGAIPTYMRQTEDVAEVCTNSRSLCEQLLIFIYYHEINHVLSFLV